MDLDGSWRQIEVFSFPFSAHIHPFGRNSFMMLRLICVLRALPLLWDLYTLSFSNTPPPPPPPLPCVPCPNSLKCVVYYPNKGFCQWISAEIGGGSFLREQTTRSAWQWASLSLKFWKLELWPFLETTVSSFKSQPSAPYHIQCTNAPLHFTSKSKSI